MGLMETEIREGWKELCEQVISEQNALKVQELVQEIKRLMEARQPDSPRRITATV